MTYKSRETRDNYVLSIRVNENLWNDIETFTRENLIKKSDFIRKAISDAISFSELSRERQTYLMGPNTMAFALDLMNDLEIEEFAILALENGKNFLKSFLQTRGTMANLQKYLTSKKMVMTGLLQFITESILSVKGQNWVDRIHYTWMREDDLVITGVHSLGFKFSRFLQFYFIHFFDIFQFSEQKEATILKGDRVKFVFNGPLDEFDIHRLM